MMIFSNFYVNLMHSYFWQFLDPTFKIRTEIIWDYFGTKHRVLKAFKTFFTGLNKYEIKNLNITFTNTLEKANFYIKKTSEKIYTFGEDYVFNNNINKEDAITTGATYHLLTDNNNTLQ